MEQKAYLDVEMIRMRNEALKAQYSTLATGIYMDGEIKEFERKEILDSFFIMTPKAFTVMPDDLADVKYPFVFRPPCILTNADLTVNLNFNQFPNHLQETTLKKVTEDVKKALENEQGNFDFYDNKICVFRKSRLFSSHYILSIQNQLRQSSVPIAVLTTTTTSPKTQSSFRIGAIHNFHCQ